MGRAGLDGYADWEGIDGLAPLAMVAAGRATS